MAKQKSQPTQSAADRSEKMRTAKTLYMQGMKLQEIYNLVKVSDRTLNKWIEDGRWSELRAASLVTSDELKSRVLQAMARLIDQAIEEDKFDRIGDDLSKVSKVLENLDKRNVVTDGMFVFKHFGAYLINRSKFDPAITTEFIQKITELQDEFIKERL